VEFVENQFVGENQCLAVTVKKTTQTNVLKLRFLRKLDFLNQGAEQIKVWR